MEATQKTPVDVVQELIALHTTRMEASEKISANGTDATLNTQAQSAAKKSEAAIAALMAELAQFGDAVGSAANRDNAYQELYKQSLDSLNNPDASGKTDLFQNLEDAFKTTYKGIMDAQADLPPTLHDLIQKQYAELG